MHSGFYAIASGLLAQQRNLDVIGNNLVNADTPGFRAERMVFTTFQHELMIRKEAWSRTFIGIASPITLVDDVVTLQHSGLYQDTGFPFDIAIDGPGFFVVQGSGEQPFLTRGGQFNMDVEGFLILPGVGRVLGQDGKPIQVKNAEFTVLPDGTINNEAGRRVGVLAVVMPPDVEQLNRMNNGMYQMEEGVLTEAAEGYRLVQGVVEKSNVDYNREMTTFIEAQRAFQSCSSALQMYDSLNRRAAAAIASV
ncbi:MAG: flagellar hook basal-body protein [Clostridiales bacterium]|nr:flagellar hook basal-body protein [Clostridiales bacterium]